MNQLQAKCESEVLQMKRLGLSKTVFGFPERVWAALVNTVSTIISLIKHIDSSYIVPYLETKLITTFYLMKGCDLHGML